MKLATLRSRLNQLRRRRAMVRQSTAWSAPVLAVLWLAAAVFVVDLLLLMDVPQRIVAWILCALVVAWVFWRYTKPWIGVKEDLVDVALLVERHQHIDSDLVAALQFQESDALRWGSPQLETAVIEYVEDFSPSLNVFEGFTHRRFKRRMAWLLGTVTLMLAVAVIFPAYAKAFANRMLLGSMWYPTDTQITRIVLNGQTVYLRAGEQLTFTGAYGLPLDFEVHAEGTLPEKGRVRLKPLDAKTEVDIELNRALPAKSISPAKPSTSETASIPATSNSIEPNSQSSGPATYRGQLPQLVGSMTYQVYLGDAWTDPLEIHVIPLPVVTVTLDPKPPAYAVLSENEADTVREGTRQIAVVEGSSVTVNLQSNNKPLQSAVLTVEDKIYPLAQRDDAGLTWSLQGTGSPLDQIREPIRYSLQVKDSDGLSLPQPIEGYIRIRADRPPRISPPELVTALVLPKAKPTVDFSVGDDYGLSKVSVRVQVVRKVPLSMEEPDEMQDQVDLVTRDMIVVNPQEQPKRSLRGRYALVLESFHLSPGDELKVTLEAFDYRGDFRPASSISEPLVLKVTDVQGILLGMRNTDERSAQSLDNIIEITSGDTK